MGFYKVGDPIKINKIITPKEGVKICPKCHKPLTPVESDDGDAVVMCLCEVDDD